MDLLLLEIGELLCEYCSKKHTIHCRGQNNIVRCQKSQQKIIEYINFSSPCWYYARDYCLPVPWLCSYPVLSNKRSFWLGWKVHTFLQPCSLCLLDCQRPTPTTFKQSARTVCKFENTINLCSFFQRHCLSQIVHGHFVFWLQPWMPS